VKIGYVYEEDLDSFLDVFVEIKGFPTYVYFKNGQEVSRVQGVNFDALNDMIKEQQQR
jgi:hypothetical protein